MKTVEFEAVLTADDRLGVPKEVASQLPRKQKLQVIILVPESLELQEEAKDWGDLARQQFLAGYEEGDSIYDSL